MTSKEFIQNEIDNLEDMLKNAKSLNCETIIKCSEEEIEQYKQVLKDLEVLDQLKEILSMDYLVRVYGYDMAKRLQTYLKSNDIVKEWLDA